MSEIKQRRLTNPVKCRPGLSVGECVPFYFCPRSVMLYVIHMANHPELKYRGGQGAIVHLEAGLYEAVVALEPVQACRRPFQKHSRASARRHAGKRTPARRRDQARVVLLTQVGGYR